MKSDWGWGGEGDKNKHWSKESFPNNIERWENGNFAWENIDHSMLC